MRSQLTDPSHNSTQPTNRPSRSALLLAIGATTGLALAAWGLLENSASARLPSGAVARVNGTVVRSEDFERLVAAVLQDMRTPDEEKARTRVLERMIDEELLIQRALDLGLIHLDRKVRADLTSSVIASVVNDVKGLEPSAEELERFFAEQAFVERIADQLLQRDEQSRGTQHGIARIVPFAVFAGRGPLHDKLDGRIGNFQLGHLGIGTSML
jgi:hypothetical protein